jgi:hypothetical protein
MNVAVGFEPTETAQDGSRRVSDDWINVKYDMEYIANIQPSLTWARNRIGYGPWL